VTCVSLVAHASMVALCLGCSEKASQRSHTD
jgi:hypothetical protein